MSAVHRMITMRRRDPAKTPGWVSRAGVTLLVVQILISAANVATWDDGVAAGVIDLNTEANLAAWWSSSLLLAIASAAAGLWLCERRLGGRHAHWLLVAVGFAGLSLEEVAGIHERVGYRLNASDTVADWPLVYLPVLVFGAAALVRTLRDLPRSRAVMVVAGLVLFSAVVVAELVSAWTVSATGGTMSLGETLVEENCELAGQGVILLALAWQLRERIGALGLRLAPRHG